MLDLFNDFAKATNFQLPATADAATQTATTAMSFLHDPTILVIAIVLVIITIFLLFFLKKIIVNSILGGIIWAAAIFVFHVQLPVIPTFVVSVLFGPAGIGAIMVLKFLGLMV